MALNHYYSYPKRIGLNSSSARSILVASSYFDCYSVKDDVQEICDRLLISPEELQEDIARIENRAGASVLEFWFAESGWYASRLSKCGWDELILLSDGRLGTLSGYDFQELDPNDVAECADLEDYDDEEYDDPWAEEEAYYNRTR